MTILRPPQMSVRVTGAVALVMTVLAPAAFAQTAGITGTVRDQGGSVLSGATIRALHTGTNAERSVMTSRGGDYAVTLLPIGIYRIEATLPSFKQGVAENIKLSVGDTVRIDFTLEVGALSETVIVTGTAPLVQSDTSALGTVIDRHQLSELPLNGRQFESLAHLVPGVVPVVQNLVNSSALGARASSNNFSLDGVDNNDPAFNNVMLRPILDAIEEFKVQTLNAAELGRGGGANIQVTTRAGTNELHGSAWEFWRNSALDARTFFASREIEKPPFNRNQFGATLGGPLVRDRTFFFLAYEGLRRRQRVISLQAIPPLPFRAGDFSALATAVRDPLTGLPFPGNVIPASRIHPAARAILARGAYPAPTPGLSGPLNLMAVNPFPNDADSISARIDHRVSRRNSLAVRYAFMRDDLLYPCTNASAVCIPGYPLTGSQHVQSLSVTDTHVLSPVLVNELRVGVNRSTLPRVALTSAAEEGRNVGAELGIPGLPSSDDPNDWGFPILMVRGYGLVGDLGFASIAGTTSYVADTLHRIAGAHSTRMGFEVRRLRLDAQAGRARDVLVFDNAFTGHPFADFLLGYPVQTQRNPVDFVRYRSTWLLGGFIQDDFKVGSRLTLNLGLRYEYNTPEVERLDRLVNVNTFTHAYEIANRDGASRALYNPDRNNVAPRLGFAYRPRASAHLVIRGGYGVFYEVGAMGNQYGSTRMGPPFFKQETFDASTNPLDLTLSDPFPAGRLRPQNIFNVRGIQTDFRDGSYQQWSLSAQAEFARDTVVELGYVGSKGRDLYRVVDVNQAILGPGPLPSRRPLPQYGSVEVLQSSGSSIYHGLLARVERRSRGGLSLRCSYTYGHAIDDGSSNLFTAIGQDAHNLAAERASADFDVRHRVVASYIWEIPFGRGRRFGAQGSTLRQALLGGWQISGITAWQTGLPLTPSLLASRSLTGPTRDRPNVTGVDPIVRDSPDRTVYLNRAAYSVPPLGTFGNAGRNSVRGPSLANTDLGVAKNFRLKDTARIQLRAELFNAFNRPQLGQPVTAVDSPAFGRISSTRADNRQVQLGIKVTY